MAMIMVVSLVIIASGFGPEVQIQDATKDPLSAYGVRARKICGSESPVVPVSSLPWVLSLEKISLPCQKHVKIAEVEMDGAAIYRQEAEIPKFQNPLLRSNVTFCFKPYKRFG